MKQIKDILTKESTESWKGIKNIKVTEDLRKNVINKVAASESYFDHLHPATEMIHKLKEEFKETSTIKMKINKQL